MTDPSPLPTVDDAVAHLREMESRLAALQGEIDHAHRLTTLGTITAGVAHEMNNLLTPVLAYAQLALKQADDPKIVRKALEKTVNGVSSASRILQAILDFSAPDAGPGFCDVAAACRGALDCLARDPSRDGIDLSIRIEPGLTVAMSPLSLQQTLLNLLLNACKAMRRRGGQITVSGKSGPGATALVAVADDGPGIPDGIAGRIFEPFVTGSAGEPGTGLGLAVCRREVEAAGGAITVEPSPGGGATFVLELPIATAAMSA